MRTKIMDYLGALRDQIVFMRTIQSLVEGGLDLGAWEELDNPMLSPGRRFLSEAERVYLSFEALHKAALELSLLVDEGEFQKELELQAQRQAGRPLKRNEHEFETPQFMEEMAEEYEHIHAMARAYLRRKRR
ncbi:hypothetical protein [Aestuariimicrobium sp. T2.26MG-19.2B]|uniref:hypothetical protein n=1 Tax=Aestuariimicrobium sp. T2.26MG-19.2B TaxID=3040679 RepID=UPI0025414976|nr:hypothetical protein [Aestuariimicrobium sp. T2.26MG-19.2B]